MKGELPMAIVSTGIAMSLHTRKSISAEVSKRLMSDINSKSKIVGNLCSSEEIVAYVTAYEGIGRS
jgi:hypothetical protein